jgi:hypothetical protein
MVWIEECRLTAECAELKGFAMRRRKLLAVLVLIILALIGATTLVRGIVSAMSRPTVSRETASRVKLGMTRAEVEAILGSEGRLVCRPLAGTANAPESRLHAKVPNAVLCLPVYEWGDNSEFHSITFDNAGKVEDRYYYPPLRLEEPGFFDEVSARAKRLWRKWFPAQ